MDQRRYSDKEIGEVLRRAAELQGGGPDSLPSEADFTLRDLERIGGEVGIGPEHVRAAAAELDDGNSSKPHFSWTGAPATLYLERTVDGELTEERWEETLSELRRSFGDAGRPGKVGATWEWKSSVGDLAAVTIMATPRHGRTKFQIMREYSGGMGLTLIVGTCLSLFGSIGIGKLASSAGVLAVVLAVIAFVAVCAMGMHFSLRNWARRDRKKLNGVMDQLASQLGEESSVRENATVDEVRPLELGAQ